MAHTDPMRQRLRELARATHKPHSAELEARLIANLRTHGPRAIVSGRRRRMAMAVSAVVLPCILLAFGFWLRGVDARPGALAQRVLAAKSMPEASVTSQLPAKTPKCAGRALSPPTSTVLPDGARFIDLGQRGKLVLDRSGEATLDTDNPCALALTLAAGRVTVRADDLLGGTLKVRAGSTDVVVHGTKFAVERAGDQLVVDVLEGVVGVQSAGRELAPRIVAGQSLRIAAAHAPSLSALSDATRAKLEAALRSAASPVTAPAPTARAHSPAEEAAPKLEAAQLLALADRRWQSGRRDEARARYRDAGAATGPTAEAAWLALARRELSIGRAVAARRALATYNARFPAGELAAEAASVEFRAALVERDLTRADRLARSMITRFAGTPQAQAAQRWRSEQGR